MDALFVRFHNFILALVRGEDGVCGCTCGRHQVYHVVPYNGAQSMVDSRENNVLSDIMTWQEMNVIVGLLLGFCISFFLQWLERIWHSRLKYKENQMSGVDFWSWMPTFSNKKESLRQIRPPRTEDSRGNMLHINHDVNHNVNDT
ncbi:transmembrane protein 240-like [Pseudoliparis swirei]|uniref:transmembrane protein 240-like n=1 Tax=Pseudoliparis swirei TaxID=2059687 RepID=UPI0024BE273A|nr:transmembrane protein 240-like [Pseudoliparis swirei]